jgi:D-amino peptidase
MTNILIEDLNPAAELACGSPKPFSMMQGIGADVNRVFLVGYHAASGSLAAVLEHTYVGRSLFDVQLNGRSVGEIGLNSTLAGSFGVPVTLVTGDRAATQEARSLLGEIETVTTKDGLGRTSALCLSPTIVRQQIRDAAERAMHISTTPLVVQLPCTLRVIFQRASYADVAALIPYSRRVDGRTVEWTGDDIPTVFRTFRAMIALASTV